MSEDVAVKFSEAILHLQVFDTDRETQEETLLETIEIDLSGLLFQHGAIDVSSTIRSSNQLTLAVVDVLEVRQDAGNAAELLKLHDSQRAGAFVRLLQEKVESAPNQPSLAQGHPVED